MGFFDPELRSDVLFDPELVPQGWFDRELIDAGAAGGPPPALPYVACEDVIPPDRPWPCPV